MDINEIRDKYIEHGLNHCTLKSIQDLKTIHQVDPEKIKGYDTLDKSKEVFENFLINFWNRQGLEARESLRPISVKIQNDAANGTYIRFDYYQGKRKGWYHVKNSGYWY